MGPLSLSLDKGQRVSIVGPSGSGKSTLIYLLAGLIKPLAGEVQISDGSSLGQEVPMFGIGFQSSDLIPWLSATENVLLPLRLSGRKIGSPELRFARELLCDLGLTNDMNKLPRAMSGGMKKRVGLARALVTESPIILLDEPFGELDEVLRRRLILWLDTYLAAKQCACLLVTHSFEEAIFFSDEVLVLKGSPAIFSGKLRVDRTLVTRETFVTSDEYRQYECRLDELLREND